MWRLPHIGFQGRQPLSHIAGGVFSLPLTARVMRGRVHGCYSHPFTRHSAPLHSARHCRLSWSSVPPLVAPATLLHPRTSSARVAPARPLSPHSHACGRLGGCGSLSAPRRQLPRVPRGSPCAARSRGGGVSRHFTPRRQPLCAERTPTARGYDTAVFFPLDPSPPATLYGIESPYAAPSRGPLSRRGYGTRLRLAPRSTGLRSVAGEHGRYHTAPPRKGAERHGDRPILRFAPPPFLRYAQGFYALPLSIPYIRLWVSFSPFSPPAPFPPLGEKGGRLASPDCAGAILLPVSPFFCFTACVVDSLTNTILCQYGSRALKSPCHRIRNKNPLFCCVGENKAK